VSADEVSRIVLFLIGPEPHPSFIDLFSGAIVGCGEREVARPGEDE
jgi:hypothetical protein